MHVPHPLPWYGPRSQPTQFTRPVCTSFVAITTPPLEFRTDEYTRLPDPDSRIAGRARFGTLDVVKA